MVKINVGGVYSQSKKVSVNGVERTIQNEFKPILADEFSVLGDASRAVNVAIPTFTGEASTVNGLSFTSGFAPIEFMKWVTVAAVGADFIETSHQGLNSFNTYARGLYDGATAEVRRYANGEMSSVKTLPILDTSFPSKALISGDKEVVSGTRFDFRFPTFYNLKSHYWFRVTPVDAGGNLGTASEWVDHFVNETISKVALENTVIELDHADGESGLAVTGVKVAPHEVHGDGVAVITWDATAPYYIVEIAYSDPQEWVSKTADIAFVGENHGLGVGDLLLIRRTITKPSPDMVSNRVTRAFKAYSSLVSTSAVGQNKLNDPNVDRGYFYQFKEIDSLESQPVAAVGKWCIEHQLDAGAALPLGEFWQAGDGQSFYEVREEGDAFNVKSWVWVSEAATLKFSSGSPSEPVQTRNLSRGWQYVEMQSRFFIEQTGTQARRFLWEVEAVSGAAMTVRHAAMVSEMDGEPFGTMRSKFAASMIKGQYWRDHTLIKTNPRSYSMDTILAPNGEGYKGWTIGQHFKECARLNLNPWTQIEFTMTESEMGRYFDTLAEYIDGFDGAYLEMGNETWNPLAGFLTMPSTVDAATGETVAAAEVYGAMLHMVYGWWQKWLQASPHWEKFKDKLHFVIGGRNGNSYGERAWAKGKSAKIVAVAQYNGGWDNNESEFKWASSSILPMQQFGYAQDTLKNHVSAARRLAADAGKVYGDDVLVAIYEAGPGYRITGLNGNTLTAIGAIIQEIGKKSRASAVAGVSAHMQKSLLGVPDNYFTVSHEGDWASHRRDGTEYLPFFVATEYARRLGAFRAYPFETVKARSTDGVKDISVYAVQSQADAGHWIFSVVNRKLNAASLPEGDEAYDPDDNGAGDIAIALPFKSVDEVNIMTAGIGHPLEHNRWPKGKRLTVDGTFVDDPSCVEFDVSWKPSSLPADLSRIQLADIEGVPDKLEGGNFLMVELKGVQLP